MRFVLSIAEWVLGRNVRTVLDVGCGEGNWLPALLTLRPRIAYEGIDPSRYAVERFGKRRNISLGGIEDIAAVAKRNEYDLVVCCGMLNYLSETQLVAGLQQVSRRTGGLAYLELFTAEDHFEGDTAWPAPKPAKWYRNVLHRAHLVPVGMQCYVHRDRPLPVASLEHI